LIVTELIFENVLADYEAEEIVALLSCFIFQEKNKSVAPPNLTPRLKKVCIMIKLIIISYNFRIIIQLN
jgi:superfamily II RNA helicase